MNGKSEPDEKLDRLIEALIDETLAMSDEEILADCAHETDDAERRLRSEIDTAIAAHRRRRFAAAQEAVAASKKVPRRVQQVGGDLRTTIARAIANDDAALTLAARQGRDVPDADLDGLAEDLRDLGLDIGGEKDSDAS